VAVAVLLSLPPETPSVGNGMLVVLMMSVWMIDEYV
jgi:hypothetical protein